MNNYSQYTVEDFAQDIHFRQWVLAETPDTKQFWEGFLQAHPEQQEAVSLAKSMVIALKIKEIPTSDSAIQQGITRILTEAQEETPVIPFYQRTWFRIAASLALLISIGFWWSRGEVPQKTRKVW
ncbi:MAG: hypothetical protein HC817_01360 [Saprospiraceae bacterium]|nr:hypothetical protein [Saprospiraceae bacterium]